MRMSRGRASGSGFGPTASRRTSPIPPTGPAPSALEQQALAHIRRGELPAAAELYQRAIIRGEASAAGLSNLAAIELSQGDPQSATEHLRLALQMAPGNAESWLNLGTAHFALGNCAAAADALRRATELKPGLAKAHANLGNTLQVIQRFPEALEAYQRALSLQPDYPEVLSNQGVALRETGDLHASLASLRRALELRPDYLDALNNLGLTLQAQGEVQEAIACYQRALALNNASPETLNNLGLALMEQGDLAGAIQRFEQALRIRPDYAEVHRHLTYCLNGRERPGAEQEVQRCLERMADHPDRYHLQFAIGKYKLDRGEADALNWFRAANRLRSQQLQGQWELPDLESVLQFNQAVLTAEQHPATPGEGDAETLCHPATSQHPRLIFIVGLPRSGSTLVETILSQCTGLVDLGEVPYLNRALQQGASIPAIREHYLRQLRNHPRGDAESGIFTDKFLYNFALCPILAAAFPECRILHVYRNPMDNLLSTFTNHFATGNEWSYDLNASVTFYHFYRQVMADHERQMPGRIQHINYDTLTRSPQQEVRALIKYCNLTWSEAFLHPEWSKRQIHTASAVQARQPINNASVGRWQHYREQLQPVADQLERLGYSTTVPPVA